MSSDTSNNTWETTQNFPTDSQVEFIKNLCDQLSLDYAEWEPANFNHARVIIEELREEAYGEYDA